MLNYPIEYVYLGFAVLMMFLLFMVVLSLLCFFCIQVSLYLLRHKPKNSVALTHPYFYGWKRQVGAYFFLGWGLVFLVVLIHSLLVFPLYILPPYVILMILLFRLEDGRMRGHLANTIP